MKRAQLISQIFIFILAGLLFVLIIIYGYNAITYFTERQEQVKLADLRTDLELAIEGVKRNFGSVRKITLTLPSNSLGICFFDPTTCATQPPTLIHQSQTLTLSWAQQACQVKTATIFLVPRALDMDFQDINVDPPGYVCIPNTGTVNIRAEGTGKSAKISTWQ